MTGLYLTYETEAEGLTRSAQASTDLSRMTGDTHETYLWPVEFFENNGTLFDYRVEIMHTFLLSDEEARFVSGLPNEEGGSVLSAPGYGGIGNGVVGYPSTPDAGS
jgi:hypothetical protein